MKVVRMLVLLSSIWLLLVQSRCKDDPQPIDPCAGVSQQRADFTIGEIVQDSFVPTDTIANPYLRVTVKANIFYNKYRWKIGDDPREWNTSSVSLDFNSSLTGQTIKVTLIAEVNKVCFPNDDGIDTMTKQFFLACPDTKGIPQCSNAPVKVTPSFYGKWRGSIQDEPNKVFDVAIVDFGDDPNERDDTLFYNSRIYNLPENCGGDQKTGACGGTTISPYFFAPSISENGYNAFYCRREYQFTCCPPMSMFGKVDPLDRNKIVIYMNYFDGRKRVFTGRRI